MPDDIELDQRREKYRVAMEAVMPWFRERFPENRFPDGAYDVPGADGQCTRVEIKDCWPERIGDMVSPHNLRDEYHGLEYSLSIDELIEKLKAFSAEYGGDTVVCTPDLEPVRMVEMVVRKLTPEERELFPARWVDPRPWLAVRNRISPEEAAKRREQWLIREEEEYCAAEATDDQDGGSFPDEPHGGSR